MNERLDELESRLAFQDDMIENLNQVVTRQDREILELKQHLAGLTDRLKEFSDASSDAEPSSAFETPPHY